MAALHSTLCLHSIDGGTITDLRELTVSQTRCDSVFVTTSVLSKAVLGHIAIFSRGNLQQCYNILCCQIYYADIRGDYSGSRAYWSNVQSSYFVYMYDVYVSDVYVSDVYVSDKYVSDVYVSDVYMSDVYVSDVYVYDVYVSDVYVSDVYVSDVYVSDVYMSEDHISVVVNSTTQWFPIV